MIFCESYARCCAIFAGRRAFSFCQRSMEMLVTVDGRGGINLRLYRANQRAIVIKIKRWHGAVFDISNKVSDTFLTECKNTIKEFSQKRELLHFRRMGKRYAELYVISNAIKLRATLQAPLGDYAICTRCDAIN